MSQKKWSPAMKLKVALSALKGNCTIAEVCEKYHVAPSQVHAWKKMLLEEGAQLFENQKKPKKKTTSSGKNREGGFNLSLQQTLQLINRRLKCQCFSWSLI
ncbi:MAG: hypothetical protein Tsb005_18710 [Gammaproteobacteria bacterium]